MTIRNALKAAGIAVALAGPLAALPAFAQMQGSAQAPATVRVVLSGDQEVPPVKTLASGSGTITINADKSISGSVATTGLEGNMAHIHEAPSGKNGPPIVTLKQSRPNEWAVPEGSKLTEPQYAAFKAGNLYINVHTAANKGGEIRGQLMP